jgi:hypothetical protein
MIKMNAINGHIICKLSNRVNHRRPRAARVYAIIAENFVIIAKILKTFPKQGMQPDGYDPYSANLNIP